MRIPRLLILSLLIILTLFLTACGTSLNSSWPGVSMDATQAYLAYGPNIHAINLTNGNETWKYPPSGSKTFYAAPVVTADGQLLVGEYQNLLESLDPKTGAVNWTFSDAKGRFLGSPLVLNDTIYAPAADNYLYALDIKGNLKWKFLTKQANWATPASDGKYIYLTSMDHHLYALDPKTGSQVWSIDLGAALICSPIIGPDGSIIVGSLGNEVVAVESDGRLVLWRKATSSGVWGTPVLKGNNIYFGDASGNIYAIDVTKQGNIIWQQKPGDAVIGSPGLMPNGLVFATETGKVIALDFTGATLWLYTANGKLYTTPVYTNNMVLLGVNNGTNGLLLVALNDKGTQLWIFPAAK